MSDTDAYLDDLRAALGGRLPPSVTAARLREARSHLFASAEDVGEAEALRRYGRARSVASGLVRAHYGYGERSAWALSMPLGVGWSVGTGAIAVLLGVCGPTPTALRAIRLLQTLGVLVTLAFFVRATQTRRWLALPMVGWQVAGTVLVTAVAAATMPIAFGRGPASVVLARGIFWLLVDKLALNALALVVGRLLDLRPVRRAR